MVLVQLQGRLRIDEKIIKEQKRKDNTLNLYNAAFKALLYTLFYVGKKKVISTALLR